MSCRVSNSICKHARAKRRSITKCAATHLTLFPAAETGTQPLPHTQCVHVVHAASIHMPRAWTGRCQSLKHKVACPYPTQTAVCKQAQPKCTDFTSKP